MGFRYRKSINLGGDFRIGQRYRSPNCLYSGNWYILCRGNRQEKAAQSYLVAVRKTLTANKISTIGICGFESIC